MPARNGANTAFMITPKELGYISIKVTATSRLAGDSVERKLLVKVSWGSHAYILISVESVDIFFKTYSQFENYILLLEGLRH